jgi:hypothetical protein
VTVTFRGQLPSDQLVRAVRGEAGRLHGAEEVHAVLRLDGSGYFDVTVEVTRDSAVARHVGRDRDAYEAITRAFDRLAATFASSDLATSAA